MDKEIDGLSDYLMADCGRRAALNRSWHQSLNKSIRLSICLFLYG
jgi:hypothetical protein